MARSTKPLALLLTCSVTCLAATSCNDDEDDIGSPTAGSTAGGMGGKSTGGSSSAGKATAGSTTAGTAGAEPGGGSAAGGMDGGAGMPGGDAGSAGGDLGGAGGVDAGGAGGAAGAGGEAGANDVGPHQTPRLEYGFDENAGTTIVDSSGRGLDATLTEAAWTSDGRSGSALALSGGLSPTQFATVPPGVFAGAKATTIGAWVKLEQNPIWARVFDVGNGAADGAARFMYLALDSNLNGQTGIRFSYFGGSEVNEATVTTGTVLPLNVWKHIAVTLAEDGEQAIYIDGFPAVQKTTVAVPPSELEPLSPVSYLGKSRFPDAGFTGSMDDFVVYDRVLSNAEIAVLAAPKADYTRLSFDEGAGTLSEDSSDRAVDAVLSGGVTWSSGRTGAAVQLSGTEQYVTLASPIAGCTDELSISLWVKHTAAANWARIFDFGGTDDNFMFLTPSTADGKLMFTAHTKTRETPLISNTTIPVDGAWHHLALVLTPTVGSVYIDGEVVGNVASPVTPGELGATNEHWLGKSRFPDPYFNGGFDEVRIMCRALTVDEVKNLAFK